MMSRTGPLVCAGSSDRPLLGIKAECELLPRGGCLRGHRNACRQSGNLALGLHCYTMARMNCDPADNVNLRVYRNRCVSEVNLRVHRYTWPNIMMMSCTRLMCPRRSACISLYEG